MFSNAWRDVVAGCGSGAVFHLKQACTKAAGVMPSLVSATRTRPPPSSPTDSEAELPQALLATLSECSSGSLSSVSCSTLPPSSPLEEDAQVHHFGGPSAPSAILFSTSSLPPQQARDQGQPTIVLDLDETLVYAREGFV
eukprot:RCo020731